MELKTYNGEHFERNKARFITFFLIIGILIIGSILSNNIIGAVFILLFIGGYFFFLTKTGENINIKIEEGGLVINKKVYPRNEIQGFVLEYNVKTKSIQNIVFLFSKGHEIYTINDTEETIKSFSVQLNEILPLLETYEQGRIEKLTRRMKL